MFLQFFIALATANFRQAFKAFIIVVALSLCNSLPTKANISSTLNAKRDVIITPDAAGILYVKKANAVSGTGNSWNDAITEFADALKAAKEINAVTADKVKQIWVAGGTYKPLYRVDNLSGANPTDRDNAFVLVKNVKVYGNFAGAETILAERKLALTNNKSILSADFADNDNVTGYAASLVYNGNAENAHHVVVDYNASVTATNTTLDGFSLVGGNANISGSINMGGFFIPRNSGGGIYCYNSSATFSNLIVGKSFGSQSGGGISVSDNTSGIKFYNILVEKNTAAFGAALMIDDSNGNSPLIVNSVFTGNRATNASQGGTILSGPALKLYNSILAGNITGIRMEANTAPVHDIRNSIVQQLTYFVSAVPTEQFNNTTALNDIFTDAVNGDYSLSLGSPAIDGGDATLYDLNISATDLVGQDRIKNGAIDMGMLEAAPVTIVPSVNGIVYVKKGGQGTKTGDSWINAAAELAFVLKTAKSNAAIQQIWVAAGTYKPLYKANDLTESLNHRDNAFVLVPDVKIYGGFAGTETSLTERNLSLTVNASILSGDFNGNDPGPTNDLSGNNSENAYHVLIAAGPLGTAEVNGFTIRGGNANSATASSIMVNASHPVIRQNGGGVYVVSSSPILKNNIIFGSYAKVYGGGLFNIASSPIITNCIINANTVSTAGGAMANIASSNPIITQVQINSNIVDGAGTHASAIYNSGSSPVITNATISRNTLNATSNKGVVSNAANSFPKIRNTIIFGNLYSNSLPYTNLGITDEGGSISTVSYSLVQGLIDGSNHNINAASLDIADVFVGNFVGYIDGYTLKLGSPAVDAGNDSYFDIGQNPDLSTLTADLAGNTRIQKGAIDMGAYETTYSGIRPDANGIVYLKANGDGDLSGDSWANAGTDLSQALFAAKSNSAIKEIWLAGGTFKPIYKAGNGTANQSKAFVLVKDLKIYGGFAGTEATLADRDLSLVANATVLSGDLNGDDGANFANYSDNVHHVIIAAGDLGTALVDGVSITGGNASDVPTTTITVNGFGISPYSGGGIYCKSASLTFSNINIYANRVKNAGGAIYNAGDENTWSTLTINNAKIKGNNAVSGAAAENNSYATLNLSNVLISENTSNSDIISSGSDDIIINLTNTTVVANSITSTEDYLMYNYNVDEGNFTLRNCLVLNNFKNIEETPELINGLGDVNFTISNSLIAGNNSTTNHNIDATGVTANDLFTSAITGDYTLKAGSIAINKGNNTSVSLTTDLAGKPRVFDGTVDLGAYERQMKQPLIDFSNLENDKIIATYGDADFSPSLTLMLPVMFSVPAANGKASIVGNKVHIMEAGEVLVTLNFAGDATYDPFTTSKTLLIKKAMQVITFPILITKQLTSPDFEPLASTNSALQLSYTSSDTNVAEVYQDVLDGNKWKIKVKGIGFTDITAIQVGNVNYTSASFLRTLQVEEGTLPVELVSYQAKLEATKVKLTWVTQSEQNNRAFIISHSTDGKNFKVLTEVQGKGSSSNVNTYQYEHLSPLTGTNYYKLTQADFNGDIKELGIKAIDFKLANDIQLYPNPVVEKATVVFGTGYQTIELINGNGSILQRIGIANTDTSKEISFAKYPPAVYFIKLSGVNKTDVRKVIKH